MNNNNNNKIDDNLGQNVQAHPAAPQKDLNLAKDRQGAVGVQRLVLRRSVGFWTIGNCFKWVGYATLFAIGWFLYRWLQWPF